MRRVTLLVREVGESPGTGGEVVRIHRADPGGGVFYVSAEHIVSVEDAPDPLPTAPGATFIGYGAKVRSAHEPCRWMVVQDVDADGNPDPARITYISQRYHEWSPSEAERHGLVRLPDPETAP